MVIASVPCVRALLLAEARAILQYLERDWGSRGAGDRCCGTGVHQAKRVS